MQLVPESKDKFPVAEEPNKRPSRQRNKPDRLTYHADTTQDNFTYNVSLDMMDDKGNSYYWEVQDILSLKANRDQTMHIKVL